MSESTNPSPWRRAGGGKASRDGEDGRSVPESTADTGRGAPRDEENDDVPIAQLMRADANSTSPADPPRGRGRQRYTESILKAAEEKIKELAGIPETDDG